MFLSIIIPVYQAEKYLKRMVDSLLCQDISDCEIILINDGSKDSSGIICNEYAEKYDNIIAINKENGGVSSARNTGLAVAKGKYITFADSDDEYTSDFIDGIRNSVKSNADLVIFSFEWVSDEKRSGVSMPFMGFTSKEDIKRKIKHYAYSDVANSVCMKIFKKETIDKNKISFTDAKIGEDAIFSYTYLKYCENIYFDENAYYLYHQNEGSAMHRYSPTKLKDREGMIKSICCVMEAWGMPNEEINSVKYEDYRRLRTEFLRNLLYPGTPAKFTDKCKLINGLSDYYRKNNIWKNIDLSGVALYKKVLIYMIKYKVAGAIFIPLQIKQALKK